MLDWVKLQSQIEAMTAYLAEQPVHRAYALLKARRALWRMGYKQRGIPVVGEFCVIHEGDYARQHPADYAEHARCLSAEEEATGAAPSAPLALVCESRTIAQQPTSVKRVASRTSKAA
jgi:hypothetical protein